VYDEGDAILASGHDQEIMATSPVAAISRSRFGPDRLKIQMPKGTSSQNIRSASSIARVRVAIRGTVQGVGFRPFVHFLADQLRLKGWVRNSPQGVFIEVEGPLRRLERFLLRLGQEKPPRAYIQSFEATYLDPVGYSGFEIRPSDETGEKSALILPDIATCPDCLREILDPSDRRYQYPFTNCTNCGPRFSIVEALPYDRARTAMRRFEMCPRCRAEYENPKDRRFHAEPTACPSCGPHMEWWDPKGKVLAARQEALLAAVGVLRTGAIVAVKGLGGFHLMVDARNEAAVVRLRELKRREEKPLALMFPSLAQVRALCAVSKLEERILLSPECPIVLLHKKARPREFLAPSIAPGNPNLGVMLPYTPLHHLLMRELRIPVVATSGNLSDEPICTDEREALERLGGIAEGFLVHDRPIVRHVDDSIVRVMAGREMLLRRARGYAPLPVQVRSRLPPVLAVGAHLKNAVAVVARDQVFVSQHIGDLETKPAYDAFQAAAGSLAKLYEIEPVRVVCDLHPEYMSTRHARRLGIPVSTVQHHHAHVVSCMAENELQGSVLGVAWDGTGYGLDETIWGGEFLLATEASFTRVAHFRTFHLPGGEKAIKEPRRSAIGLLHRILGDDVFEMTGLAPVRSFQPKEREILRAMLNRSVRIPVTSSVGRLFDAVAALADIRQVARFEGQAAMELEFALEGAATDERYDFDLLGHGEGGGTARVIDWAPMVRQILEDVREGVMARIISAKFHNTLVEAIVHVARLTGEKRVVLTGGCFQNKYLLEHAVTALRENGFCPYWHQRVPPNDGGIALGQIIAAAAAA
jgi:hydrogenase maturation protein HypF